MLLGKKKIQFIIFVFLFIFISLVSSNRLNANSSQDDLKYNSAFANGGGFYVTKPQCPNPPIGEIVLGIIVVKKGAKIIYGGIKSYKKATNKWSKGLAIAQIGLGATGIVGFIMASAASWQCYFSFARDPIAFDKDGNLLGKDQGGKNITLGHFSKITKKDRLKSFHVPYSNYLTICTRSPFPYITRAMVEIPGINLISGLITVGDVKHDKFSCYDTKLKEDIDFERNEYFDGAKAFLCPEEWRVHNYKYKLAPDPNPEDETSIESAKIAEVFNEEKVLSDFLEMKQNNGSLICKTGKIGDKFKIHGYEYQIIKQGAKVCGRINGLDVGFSAIALNKSIIGCHYKVPDDLSPICKESKPILVKDPINNADVIIDYDDSPCFSCFVDKSCYSKSSVYAKSVIPITSNIVECFESSINHVLFGCQKTQKNDKHLDGMLSIANNNLSFIAKFALLLFIILFGIKIALAGHMPQTNELIISAIKIGIVLFFTYADSEKKGIFWLYNQILNISSGLSSITLDAMSKKNNICKFDDALYSSQNVNVSYRNNYSFLKPFDILDCNLFFYLGGYAIGYDGTEDTASIIQTTQTVAFRILGFIVPFLIAFDILGIILFFFAILILSLVVWLISLVLYSIVFLAILILISPLIIPSILFPYTKGFFDVWIKELFAYSMLSPFLYLFLTLMITTFNKPIFGNTEFKQIDGNLGGRNVIHFGYNKINCGSDENKTKKVCKECLELTGNKEYMCDGCDINALACSAKYLKLSTISIPFGLIFVAPDKEGEQAINLVSNVGQLLIMSLIFLTLLKAIIIIIAKTLGGSRTLYALLDHGEDPLSNFYKFSKKSTSFANSIQNSVWKLGSKNKDRKKNGVKNKDNSSSINGSFE